MRKAFLLLVCALALACALPAGALAQAPGASPGSEAALTAAQQRYLALAEAGVARAQGHWRDSRRGWYDARLHDHERYPLATIWDIVPLFQSLDAIAIASPTPSHRKAVDSFAAGAERYLNKGLRPVPGYSPYPGDREANTETWFDDNGWWGLGFVEAYRATGSPRWLADAEKALRYIARSGWDPAGGGIWWNTQHPYKAGAALASDTLLATLLYQLTGSSFDLAQAQRFLAWGNTSGFSTTSGLYVDSTIDSEPVDYIEAPLIYAQATLCRLLNRPAECALAERLKTTALDRFGYLLDFSPQYDAIYLQWMLALYASDGDATLYHLAADNARDAQTRAANGEGLYLLSWNGETLPAADALPGMLQTQAATTSLFAWLAVYRPPA
ncbi:MAG: glycoside hydrolase family 76 protein [Solirubrobacteraceae bacterium]